MGRKATLFVYVWTGACLYCTLMVLFNGEVADAAPSVVVNFNDTRCTNGGKVCSTDPLLFTCTGNELTVLSMIVTLPNGDPLSLSRTGAVSGTIPDGFSVISRSAVPNDGNVSFNFTLSLSIENASLLNGDVIACDDNTIREMAGCSVVGSGPAAPSVLEQVCSANTLTSANVASATFTWQEPTDTGGGGIDISHYTVNTSLGSPVTTPTLSHTLTGLELETNYTVSVTATNECGLESVPSEDLIIRIPVGNPPAPAFGRPVIGCAIQDDDNMPAPVNVTSPVNVTWEYEATPNVTCPGGLVYPPITNQANVTVSYIDPVNMKVISPCPDLSGNDKLCLFNPFLTTNGSRRLFSISINVTVQEPVIRSTESRKPFELFRVVQEGYLNSPNPGVNVTLNEFCRKDVEYTVRVNFGTRLPSQDEDDCMFVDDASVEMTLEPGQTKFFRLDKVKVPTGMVYCSDATLNGNDLGTTGQGGHVDPGLTDDEITYIVVVMVVVVVAVALQILLNFANFYLIRKLKSHKRNGGDGFSTCAIIIRVISMFLLPLAIIVLCVLIWKLKSGNGNDDQEMKTLRSSPGPSPVVKEPAGGDQGPMYQDPNTITHTAHPETGELYADIHLDKSKKKKGKKAEEESAGPMYQDPSSIQHQQAESGDVYAMPQAKKSKKGKKREESVSEEEKAAMYSMPDRKGQKAKSEGLVYADLAISSSSQQPPPPQGSQYADIRHQD